MTSQTRKEQDLAAELFQQHKDSRYFMRDYYYDEWEEVYKNYKCVVDPRKDANGKVDADRTNIGMPDTFAIVNRRTARTTAQIPEIRFTAKDRDPEVEQAVSVKVMRDWDVGGVQRDQKRHVRQAEMFGWSVCAWSWEVDEYHRRRGLDISRPLTDEEIDQIDKTYKVSKSNPQAAEMLRNPATRDIVLKSLLQTSGKRGLLNVDYLYKAYEGPRREVLFAGDCYPEPFFINIQRSGYFIVQMRKNQEWLENLGRRWPQFQDGITHLLTEVPKGTDPSLRDRSDDGFELRERLRNSIGKPSQHTTFNSARTGSKMWTIYARWIPGRRSKVAFAAEGSVWLGEIKNPYDLDGKIPFTELILIDDILGGCGDSVSRIARGLQRMHNLQTNTRFDLYRHVAYPVTATTDRAVYDNPKLINRDLGRVIHARGGPNSIWQLGDAAAISAMAASMNEEAGTSRMFQMAGGDSNMSMAANVDPGQLRTATGAKLLQANQDVLTADMQSMFHMTSVQEDAMMDYQLNRSEMADAVPIESNQYLRRNYDPNSGEEKEAWITAEPRHFQVDGELQVKSGSTLADDDEANVAKATNAYQMLNGNPYVNPQALVEDLLIAHGKGKQLGRYIKQPDPPPVEPPIKGSVAFRFDAEKADEGTQRAVLQAAGIDPATIDAERQKALAEATGAPPPAPAAPGQPPEEMPPPDAANLAAAAGGVQ